MQGKNASLFRLFLYGRTRALSRATLISPKRNQLITLREIAQGEAKPVDEDDLRSGGELRVLRDHDLPSVLLEMGFITNEGDRALFEDGAWRETMGYAVAMAVESLFASDHLGLQ